MNYPILVITDIVMVQKQSHSLIVIFQKAKNCVAEKRIVQLLGLKCEEEILAFACCLLLIDVSHIVAYFIPLILHNRNFASQDGSLQLIKRRLTRVYDHDIDSPRLIKFP